MKATKMAREGHSLKSIPKSIRAEINGKLFSERIPDKYKEVISDLDLGWVYEGQAFGYDSSFKLEYRFDSDEDWQPEDWELEQELQEEEEDETGVEDELAELKKERSEKVEFKGSDADSGKRYFSPKDLYLTDEDEWCVGEMSEDSDGESPIPEVWETVPILPLGPVVDRYEATFKYSYGGGRLGSLVMNVTSRLRFGVGFASIDSNVHYRSSRLKFCRLVDEDEADFRHLGFVFPLSRGRLTMYKILADRKDGRIIGSSIRIEESFNRAEIRSIDALISNMIRPKYRLY